MIEALAKAYFEARIAADKAHAESVAARERMDEAKRRLIDHMVDAEMPSFKYQGRAIAIKRSFSCSVTQENEHDWYDWLESEMGDATPYVKSSVSKKAVLELLRNMSEDDEGKVFPEFMAVSTRPNLSVQGWKDTW